MIMALKPNLIVLLTYLFTGVQTPAYHWDVPCWWLRSSVLVQRWTSL